MELPDSSSLDSRYELVLTNGFAINPFEKISIMIDPFAEIRIEDYIVAVLESGDMLFGQITKQSHYLDSIEISCIFKATDGSNLETTHYKLTFEASELKYLHKIMMIHFR